jgi:hypothetical protein
MLKQLPDGRFYDPLTGQIIDRQEIYLKPDEDYRIIKKKSNADDSFIPWGKDRPFVKMFIDYMPQLGLVLSGGALAIAFRLSEYICYGSNLIARRGGNAITNADIQEMMGYSEKTVTRLMQELVDNMILYRGRTGRSYQYFANPYLFSRGTVINSTLAAMFKDYPKKYAASKNIEGVEPGKSTTKH